MVSPVRRIPRVEGVLEQINERLGTLERQGSRIMGMLDRKADKSEVRLLFVTTTTLLVAVIGLLGAVLAKI